MFLDSNLVLVGRNKWILAGILTFLLLVKSCEGFFVAPTFSWNSNSASHRIALLRPLDASLTPPERIPSPPGAEEIDSSSPAPLTEIPASKFTVLTSPSLSDGLSKFHQSIVSRTGMDRQRFLTGRDPLIIAMKESPTKKWLLQSSRTQSESTTVEILVNGTALQKSMASLDRLSWLEDNERQELIDQHCMYTMEFIAEIKTERPGYIHLLPATTAGKSAFSKSNRPRTTRTFLDRIVNHMDVTQQEQPNVDDHYYSSLIDQDRLWVTGFSLAGRRGIIKCVDGDSGKIVSVRDVTSTTILWPNEVNRVPARLLDAKITDIDRNRTGWIEDQDALLVADGFLVPGKDRGGIYVIRNPGNTAKEVTVRLTDCSAPQSRWFYHRAIWLDLTNDGRKSILTARCKISTIIANTNEFVTSGVSQQGELVWLECPQPYAFDSNGEPIECDGSPFDPFLEHHLPWKEHKLADGPDVMFSVADFSTEDDTIEVISSEFFNQKVVLRSIKTGLKPQVVFERTIDEECGPTFGSLLVDLDRNRGTKHAVINSGSTVDFLQEGEPFSHLLVTSHESRYEGREESSSRNDSKLSQTKIRTNSDQIDGGSLFAYRVPTGRGGWKSQEWKRTTVATGFKVNGRLSNIVNPGAPGFVYAFHERLEDKEKRRPMIAVAGDCSESAYIFRPSQEGNGEDDSTSYRLMTEIQCESTVGSIGIGYSEFTNTPQESGYAKIFIPCFEKDRIFVFALGSGEDAIENDDGW